MDKKKNFSDKKYATIGFFAGIINGLFGGGGGMILVPFLAKEPAYGQKKAQATAMAVMLPVSLLTATLCLIDGIFPFKRGFATTLGVSLGAIVGAKILYKLDKEVVQKFFCVFICVLGVKMLVF